MRSDERPEPLSQLRTGDAPADFAHPAPRTIGPYHILRTLGEGGMGTVYLAEQRHPLRRQVALKVSHLGLDSSQVVARFESERQTLALMDHPNIATVFDAGISETGLPYFVMEYVTGSRITTYCDREQLTVHQRLELFVEVCGAVQHAHHKGIIHRDIKPSNVLVTIHDGKPVPKVIDFGIAKATHGQLADGVRTEQGMLLGTPEYMSPEQAAMGGLDVDTRTDVYSLGVLLYELLVGVLPLDSQMLRAQAVYDVPRIIRDTEPPRPSTRLMSLGYEARDTAKQRQADLSTLRNQLRGDLDWIVMKAIAKERDRRYETANGLAMDVRRYLTRQPVLARPPSAGYIVGRFIQRNRLAVSAGIAVAVALVLGTVLMSIGLIRAQSAEQAARTEADTSGQIADFLVELFEISDPSEARGNSITAREILDRAAERLKGETLTTEPAVRARLLNTISKVYQSLGLSHDSVPLAEEALVLQRSTAPGSKETAEALETLGGIRSALAEYEAAEALALEALAIRQRIAPESPEIGSTLELLGSIRLWRSDFDGAERYFIEAQRIFEGAAEDDPLKRAEIGSNLGVVATERGDWAAAAARFRDALAIYRTVHGETHPDINVVENNLAIALRRSGQLQEAEQLYRKILASSRAMLGDEHPQTANTMNNLAVLLIDLMDYEGALPLARDALNVYRKIYGDEHPQMANVGVNLGRVHMHLGDFEQAERLQRAAVDLNRRLFEPGNRNIGSALGALAETVLRQRRFSAAEAVAREAVDVLTSALGETHPSTAGVKGVLGAALVGQARYEEAEPLLLESVESAQDTTSEAYRRAVGRLVELYTAWGDAEKASQWRGRLD